MEFKKGKKYILRDKEFNIKRLTKFSGIYTKGGTQAPYYKFLDLSSRKNDTINLYKKQLDDYEITEIK